MATNISKEIWKIINEAGNKIPDISEVFNKFFLTFNKVENS